MSTRWDVERAVAESDLPTAARVIMYALAILAEAKTAAIPAAHTPSLTQLESMTGLSRTCVMRSLNRLEIDGWLVRKRPPASARGTKVRTKYRLTIPTGRVPQPLEVGAEGHQSRGSELLPRGSELLEVGAEVHQSRGCEPPKELDLDLKRDLSASGLVAYVAHASGASREEAAAIIDQIRRTRSPRNLVGFVRRMADDGDLDQLLIDVRASASKIDSEAAWAAIKAGPECEHRMPGGAMPHPATGDPVCPLCRAGRAAVSVNGHHDGGK